VYATHELERKAGRERERKRERERGGGKNNFP